MLKKLAAAMALLVVVLVMSLFGGWLSYHYLANRRVLMNTATLLQKVQTLSQFTTVRYTLEKVIVFDDAKWYGDSRVVLVAHGVVKAGIDLDQIGPKDIEISGRHVRITLPRPRVTDAYIEDHQTQVVERSTGLLRLFDKDLEQHAREEAVEDLRLSALHNGILKDASERAESQLKILFYELGFTQVELRSK